MPLTVAKRVTASRWRGDGRLVACERVMPSRQGSWGSSDHRFNSRIVRVAGLILVDHDWTPMNATDGQLSILRRQNPDRLGKPSTLTLSPAAKYGHRRSATSAFERWAGGSGSHVRHPPPACRAHRPNAPGIPYAVPRRDARGSANDKDGGQGPVCARHLVHPENDVGGGAGPARHRAPRTRRRCSGGAPSPPVSAARRCGAAGSVGA